jgi:hypothetical protein
MKNIKDFKIGDKLLCKKNYDSYEEIMIGKYYEITDVLNAAGIVVINDKIFSIYKSLGPFSSINFCYLWDCFNTEQEERKIKMQILNLMSKIEK